MAHSTKKLRDAAKGRFTRKVKDFNKYTDDQEPMDIIIPKYEEVKEAWCNLEKIHDEYMSTIDESDQSGEEEWIQDMQQQYNIVVKKVTVFKRMESSTPSPEADQGKSSTSCIQQLELEKMKLPHFSGVIREYGRFKHDFQKYVQPTVAPDTVTYMLRSCLSKEAAHCVRHIDDDVEKMWKDLDDKYADASTFADVIVDEIKTTRPFTDSETTRFVKFVDIVEDGYYDLQKLGLERELTTTSSVSIIEKKLSPSMKRQWARKVTCVGSTVDKLDKFPHLLAFLKDERSAIEYECAALRTSECQMPTEARIHTVDVTETGGADTTRENTTRRLTTCSEHCLIHTVSNHRTQDCLLYLMKSVDDRFDALKRVGACFSCLRHGHRLHECTVGQKCGEKGCTRRHHSTLHRDTTSVSIRNNGKARHAVSKETPSTKQHCHHVQNYQETHNRIDTKEDCTRNRFGHQCKDTQLSSGVVTTERQNRHNDVSTTRGPVRHNRENPIGMQLSNNHKNQKMMHSHIRSQKDSTPEDWRNASRRIADSTERFHADMAAGDCKKTFDAEATVTPTCKSLESRGDDRLIPYVGSDKDATELEFINVGGECFVHKTNDAITPLSLESNDAITPLSLESTYDVTEYLGTRKQICHQICSVEPGVTDKVETVNRFR